MGDELKWFLKEELGVFLRVVILLSPDTPTSHTVSLHVALFVYGSVTLFVMHLHMQ